MYDGNGVVGVDVLYCVVLIGIVDVFGSVLFIVVVLVLLV